MGHNFLLQTTDMEPVIITRYLQAGDYRAHWPESASGPEARQRLVQRRGAMPGMRGLQAGLLLGNLLQGI